MALTDDQIIERLRIEDEAVITAVYGVCLDLLYKEEERAKNLDTKGSTLLGVSGLTSTVVFSLGGLLIEKVSNLELPVIGKPLPILSSLYVTSSITLLACILMAVLAIRARSDWKWIDDNDVFHDGIIAGSINEYKRYLAVHYWSIKSKNFHINESKGKTLRAGYWLFFAALIQILPIVSIIGLYSYTKGTCIMSDSKPPATPTPGAGVSRTSGIFENAVPNTPTPPKPAPSGGTSQK